MGSENLALWNEKDLQTIKINAAITSDSWERKKYQNK
jgi:hypothetical protein